MMPRTKDETVARRTLNLVPAPPANQAVMFADRVAGDELFLDADPAPQAPPRLTSTRCAVCERGYVEYTAPAKLCGPCLGDLNTTHALVVHCLDAIYSRQEAATAAWQQTLAGSSASDRWARVEDAIAAVAEGRLTQAQLDAQWLKRKAEGGPLAVLLVAYETFAQTIDQCNVERQRWHRAQVEVNAAWLETDL